MKHALRWLHMWKDLSGCLAILWHFTLERSSNHAKLLTEGAVHTPMKSSSFYNCVGIWHSIKAFSSCSSSE